MTENPATVALGKLSGAKGGKARADKLTSAKRREIAQKRWRSSRRFVWRYFDQRFCAISRRFADVNLSARALPPFAPLSLPSATVAGFRSSGIVPVVCLVAMSPISFASAIGSRGRFVPVGRATLSHTLSAHVPATNFKLTHYPTLTFILSLTGRGDKSVGGFAELSVDC